MSGGLGIVGGTFDPPHIGHLMVATHARRLLDLDRVLLVVANSPWQKVGSRPISPAADRLAMVRAAVEPFDGLEASDVEIRRGGDSYMVDTVAALVEEGDIEPGERPWMVLGSDAAAGLDTWEQHEQLRTMVRLAVVERSGGGPPPAEWEWTALDVPPLSVSSSKIRRRVADGLPVDVLVPQAVVAEIAARNLFCEKGVREGVG